ncbi:hypothetical protein K1Y37_26690 [Serratia marcescens]|uniref:hypothetical protein n=1 Tax=Serratia marcescens TaxID=615 RepID=UPI002238F2FB|nr:hypothetical protein [Serratia marcescens]MCW6026272.1 hypothetical protein [Serratia marcescens]
MSPISMQVPSVKQIMAALAVLENKPKDVDKASASKMGFMKNPFKTIRLKMSQQVVLSTIKY